MIKRKINNSQNNQGQEEFEINDLHTERDFKNLSKKNLEEIYSKVLKNLDDVKANLSQIESRIDCLKEKNNVAESENISLNNDFTERKNYTRNLEFLIMLILELTCKTDRNSWLNSAQNANTLPDLDLKLHNQELSTISRFASNTDKAFLLKSLIENCDDEVVKSMVVKCLDKYQLKLEDIDITISKKSKPGINISYSHYSTASENSPAHIGEIPAKLPTATKSDFFSETKGKNQIGTELKCKIKHVDSNESQMNNKSVASPTSIISTNDCIFTVNSIIRPAQNKAQTGTNYRRRKTEGESMNSLDASAGDLNLNQNEKDTMFEEVNGVTHFLISSPSMSPQRIKKYDSNINFNQEQHENILRTTSANSINPIFFNSNYSPRSINNNNSNNITSNVRTVCNNQPKYNPENFFSFSEENNTNPSLLNYKHN